jgi:hypothetical protein
VLASDSKNRIYPTNNINIETLALPYAGRESTAGAQVAIEDS